MDPIDDLRLKSSLQRSISGSKAANGKHFTRISSLSRTIDTINSLTMSNNFFKFLISVTCLSGTNPCLSKTAEYERIINSDNALFPYKPITSLRIIQLCRYHKEPEMIPKKVLLRVSPGEPAKSRLRRDVGLFLL
jgi:hypothetical protein